MQLHTRHYETVCHWDLCQWPSRSIVLWLYYSFRVAATDRDFQRLSSDSPKQALHDTSIIFIYEDCVATTQLSATLIKLMVFF